ncbi:MAG: very short patch repair endonuclease [Actinobacteria bacterium]|nr:very short patch repair endonuclease [Actinomycetota bacterium]
MKANGPRNTGPELLLRSALHRRGLRFRVHRSPERDVRTIPDIVFGPARTVVFVDGCFWHRCPEHGNLPKANREWWTTKLDANVARDRRFTDILRGRGWTVIRVWEHESVEGAADRIEQSVRNAHPATTRIPWSSR